MLCLASLGNERSVHFPHNVDGCKRQRTATLETVGVDTEHIAQVSSLHVTEGRGGGREGGREGGEGEGGRKGGREGGREGGRDENREKRGRAKKGGSETSVNRCKAYTQIITQMYIQYTIFGSVYM